MLNFSSYNLRINGLVKITALLVLTLLLTTFSGAVVARIIFAQSTGQSLQIQGLGIDPFLIEVNMAPGDSIRRSITLTNTTNEPLTFSASINDFIPNGNTGQPLFLKADEQSDPKFSISRWITVTQQPQFTIAPQEKTDIEFVINVPFNAEPGTHYGGILFGQQLGSIAGSGSVVQHKGGAIILVRLGNSDEKVVIENFKPSKDIYQSGPIDFSITLNNVGNVHSRAKGDIAIRNIWGRQVTEVPVNPDALIILPQSNRDFISQWQNKLGFGRYTAEAVLYYGSPKLELRAQTSFWIIPIRELILGVIITLILGIIGYIGIRRYNRYIINRSANDSNEN